MVMLTKLSLVLSPLFGKVHNGDTAIDGWQRDNDEEQQQQQQRAKGEPENKKERK